MKFTLRQYADALSEATKDADELKLKSVIGNFVRLLARKGVLSKSPQIIEAYKKHRNEQEGIQEVAVTTARTCEGLEKYFERKTRVKQTIDPSLIGGAKIRIDDDVWDGSIRKRLQLLKEQLSTFVIPRD